MHVSSTQANRFQLLLIRCPPFVIKADAPSKVMARVCPYLMAKKNSAKSANKVKLVLILRATRA